MPIRLLVVEDNPQDWLLFSYLLEDLQHDTGLSIECEWAPSGPQGLERMDHQHFDAVVLDQQMPEMSGSEVMAALPALFRTRRDRPKVLAYSNCDLPEFGRKCLAEGADGFLPKYMSVADLARVLGEFGLLGGSGAGSQ